MAESSLSIGFSDLKEEVGFFLGKGRTIDNWSAAVESAIEGIIQSGVRRVYYPPAIRDNSGKNQSVVGYEWSWLRPTDVLQIYAAYGTGTVTIASGVVTLTDGTFPAWAADAELSVSGNSYTVATRDGDTQITLDDTTVTVSSAASYSLGQVDYDLPDDFGRLVGALNFPTDTYLRPISVISISKLLSMRAGGTLVGEPTRAAVRYKSSTGASGQRQEILFYPTPMTDRNLKYEYEAYSGVLSDTYPYPLGGMQLAELYIESCLAIAESRYNDSPGEHTEQFERLLVDAVARDRKRGARNYGYMGNKEEVPVEFRRGWSGETYSITYKGEEIT